MATAEFKQDIPVLPFGRQGELPATVKGELQLDNGFGVPYFTTVFQDNFHLEMWATAVREMVSGLDFVESIEGFDYEYDFSMKKLKFALTVKTEDEGTITVTEEGV